MRIDILSIFNEGYFAPLNDSIVKRAGEKNIVSIHYHNLRDYTKDVHKTVDDRPYGGGPGMVFKPQPLYDAITDIKKEGSLLIYPSPKGEVLSQGCVEKLVKHSNLFFICGHYEGIDDRIPQIFSFEEISIGDYVITSGSLAAMVIIDAVVRQLPGVLGCDESVRNDSFFNDLLDYPDYTRPYDFLGYKVPDVLLSGNHADIEAWRLKQAQIITQQRRPDLWQKYINNKDKFNIK